MKRLPTNLWPLRRGAQFCLAAVWCAMAAVFQAAAQIPSVAVLVQDKTPPGLFGWNKAGAGTLASIESAMQKGLGSSGKYSVLTRSQFDAILAEQNLAYKNVVNNRARLGRLSGTDYIVVAELISDRKDTRHERITAYGLSETQTTLSSEAQLAVGVMDVSSGAVVTQQAFAASIPDSHRALPAVLDQTAAWLGALRLRPEIEGGGGFKVRIAPLVSGSEARGLDIFIDGNFEANTPATLPLEGGIREITIKQADKTLWSNRTKVTRDLVIATDLTSSISPPR